MAIVQYRHKAAVPAAYNILIDIRRDCRQHLINNRNKLLIIRTGGEGKPIDSL